MDIEDEIRRSAMILIRKPPFLVLTGAGISVESGLPPFRGPGGIWERYDPEEYGHIDTFNRDPEISWRLLEEMVRGSLSCLPNGAHSVLARLEKLGLCGPIITQNVDGLHKAAGSIDILDVHGDARHLFCPDCGSEKILEKDDADSIDMRCGCGSFLRPDIVFFGEPLPKEKIERAFEMAISGVDLLVIGTTAAVMPVAQIPALVRTSGGKIVEMNPEPSCITGTVSDVYIRSGAVAGMEALETAIIDLLHQDSPKGFI